MNAYDFKFRPRDWVKITFGGVNYRGRIVQCKWAAAGSSYQVEYVNDCAEFKEGEFLGDELELG